MPLSTSSHRKNPSDRSKRNPSALEAILQGRNNFESILTWILCMFFIILLLPFSVQFISNYDISLLLIHSFSEIFTLISLHRTFSVNFFWTTYVLPIYNFYNLMKKGFWFILFFKNVLFYKWAPDTRSHFFPSLFSFPCICEVSKSRHTSWWSFCEASVRGVCPIHLGILFWTCFKISSQILKWPIWAARWRGVNPLRISNVIN